MRDDYRLAIVLITHEMDAVRQAADAVAEIRDGEIVQYGTVSALLAQPDSALGQRLLPLTAQVSDAGLVLQLSYRTDVAVASDWISRISQQFALKVDLLGAHVERVNGIRCRTVAGGHSFSAGAGAAGTVADAAGTVWRRPALLSACRRYGRRYERIRDKPDTPWPEIPALMLPALGETALMVGIVMLFVVSLGGVVGVVLFNTSPRGLFPQRGVHRVLSWIVNMGRSLPFLVLMAAIIPFTFWLTGTTIGIPAAVVPMIAAGIPLAAGRQRITRAAGEVTAVGLVCGGSRWQIIRSAQLSEALPAIVAAITLNLISMIEYSAIAGTIGAGGIGYGGGVWLSAVR